MKDISPKQQQMHKFAHATARVLISPYFMAKAIGQIIDPAGMEQLLAVNNVPSYLLWPNAGFELMAALAI